MDPKEAIRMLRALSLGANDAMKENDMDTAASALDEAADYMAAIKQWIQRGGGGFNQKLLREAAMAYVKACKRFEDMGGSLDMLGN